MMSPKSIAALGCIALQAFGQLRTASPAQQPASAAPHVRKVVGETFKLVLLSDGSVLGWGDTRDGQLGAVPPANVSSMGVTGLVSIPLPAKAADVAARTRTSYAVLEGGTVVAWGRGYEGSLGNGSQASANSTTPVPVKGLTDVIQIEATDGGALVLHKDGTVSAWGPIGGGVLGDGRWENSTFDPRGPAFSPQKVPGVGGIVQLSMGGQHVLALNSGGRVITWGSNYNGALGRLPRRERPLDIPREVPGLADVAAIAAGGAVSTVLKKDGTVWVWGANVQGQFGNGQRTDPPGVDYGWEVVPQKVPGVANATAITVGLTGRHTLTLLKDGTLRGWGNTDWGQLGAGVSGTFQLSPVVPRISGVRSIFAAGNNTFAVKTDGSLWIWGVGGRGEWPLTANAKLPVRLELK
jgi:alpha-tubulin suppressor-like RCC1 family protein